jgi:riboflavin-specific deaminase-like protein
MVPGSSPLRVVLDSTLRTPPTARVLDAGAATAVITTERSSEQRRACLRDRHVDVRLVPAGPAGVDLPCALASLRASGVRSLLVEGGARVITSMLASGVVDRLIVGVAPIVIGHGIDAVGQLGVTRLTDGIRLTNRAMHVTADDVLLSWDVERAPDDGPDRRAGRHRP